ncbi:hypothetical protein SETIT_7G252700v2 [Setaria italica]|uniref:Leucine-rich repeat-containing N-terminal plant-type domain-containing protein n=1 Tax=Setaria italica TaxID=4555 RepID=A0A368RZU7_SETIT|nr:hypothetical protein SETIT_7G252700v2 [Setaria italica]
MAAVRFLLLQGTVLTWLLLILPMPSSSSLQAKRSNGRCITSERDALLSLKAGLSDPGGQLSSWQGEDCCQWKGVHCSNRTSHVVKLDLHGDFAHSENELGDKLLEGARMHAFALAMMAWLGSDDPIRERGRRLACLFGDTEISRCCSLFNSVLNHAAVIMHGAIT